MEWHELHEQNDLSTAILTSRQKMCLSIAAMLHKISEEAVLLYMAGLYGGDGEKAIDTWNGMTSISELAELLDLTLDDDRLASSGLVFMSILNTKEALKED